MIKLYILILSFLLSMLCTAQNVGNKGFQKLKGKQNPASINNQLPNTYIQQNKKATGDTIWSEDFTNGFPTGWSVYDSTGNNAVWIIQPQGSGAIPDANFTMNQLNIASKSGGNYMLLYSDLYNSPGPSSNYYEMNSFFQTAAIPLNNLPGVIVEFQQSFRWCCDISNSKAVLTVSTDPTFTTNVMEYDIKGRIDNNTASPDPMNMSVNISAIAANYTGDIYLRFHIKNGISAYYWMIDDIHIVESPINDIQVSNGFYGFDGYQYTRIPYTQVQPMDFSIHSVNNGSANQTGTNFTVDIDDGSGSIFNGSSNDTTINSLSTDTFNLNEFWTPPINPTDWNTPLTVSLDVFSDSLDETPSNNIETLRPFQVTLEILAIDEYSTTPGNGGGAPGPNNVTEYEAGNYFKIFNDEPLFYIELVTGDGTPPGTFVDVVLYQVDSSSSPISYNEIWRSQSYSIIAADLNTPKKFYNTPGTAIVNLQAGQTYFAAAHSYIDYQFATSGSSFSPQTGLYYSEISYPNMASPNANSSFHLSTTPMIRLGLNYIANKITELTINDFFQISPNPTSGDFSVILNSEKQEEITVTITNSVGQEVINRTLNIFKQTKEKFSLNDYNKGIYFVTVKSKKGIRTSKLIVE